MSLSQPERVAVYARVSSAENKPDLDSQAERLVAYCSAKGCQVEKVVKEIGSGVNDARPKMLHLLEDRSTTVIVDKERAGASPALSSLVSSPRPLFCARMYGLRRAKGKTEKSVQELEAHDATG